MSLTTAQKSSTPSNRSRRVRKWLAEFDRSAALLHDNLAMRYGESDAAALVRGARERCEDILAVVSWVGERSAPAMNTFLGITAQELAVYQTIDARGGTPSEAWELCHEAIRLRMKHMPRWKRWLLNRILFSRLVRHVIRQRAKNPEPLRAGGFETRSVVGDGVEFDHGVDYVRCGNLELARKVGADAFAPYLCMSDIALSDGLGWGLIRTQTLADGCSHCDFRFKQGGETQIISRTPAVQETIDRIARAEAAGGSRS